MYSHTSRNEHFYDTQDIGLLVKFRCFFYVILNAYDNRKEQFKRQKPFE